MPVSNTFSKGQNFRLVKIEKAFADNKLNSTGKMRFIFEREENKIKKKVKMLVTSIFLLFP